MENQENIWEKRMTERLKKDTEFRNQTKKQEVKKMQTKSRYEVISDLEQKKRELIQERDSLNDQLTEKEKVLKNLERQKEDTLDDQLTEKEKVLKNLERQKEDTLVVINQILNHLFFHL